jgi:hypothetical protein
MPLAGEAVTVSSMPFGTYSTTASSVPSRGITSYLGRLKASANTSPVFCPITVSSPKRLKGRAGRFSGPRRLSQAHLDELVAARSCSAFSGLKKTRSATVAGTVPSGRSTSSSIPISLYSTGTMANPMFFSRRGE